MCFVSLSDYTMCFHFQKQIVHVNVPADHEAYKLWYQAQLEDESTNNPNTYLYNI